MASSVAQLELPHSNKMFPGVLLFRACGILVVMVPPFPVHGLVHRNGFSYQRTGMDHSKTRMSKLSVERFHVDALPFSSGTQPPRESHGVMELDRDNLLATFRLGLRSPRLVSARRGGRRGLADWLCSLKSCVLVCLGSQILICHERSPYSLE